MLRTPEARADLEALLELFSHGRRDVEVGYRLGWLILFLSGDDQDDALLESAANGFALCLLAGVEDLPAELLPGIASVAESLARAVLNQALGSSDPALMDLAVAQQRRILAATPDGYEARPQRLHNLGTALHARFDQRPSEEDLTAALALYREAVDTTLDGDPDLWMRLSGMAGVLWSRHRLKGDAADLDAAVDTVRTAADVAPAGSTHQATCLSNLGLILRDRFRLSEDPADLDRAFAAGRQAWELTPDDDPNRSQRLFNLVGTLLMRYEHIEGSAALDEAVARLGAAAPAPADLAAVGFLSGSDDITPEVASDVARLAAGLATGWGMRVESAYDPGAHEGVLTLWRRILRITPAGCPHRHIYLTNLSHMLLLRYHRTGTAADLTAALDTARRAVRAAREGAPFRELGLTNLAAALTERYKVEGVPEDLELAVDLQRTVVAGLPHGHQDRARALSDLGGVLGMLFGLHEDLSDLDDAVTALHESVTAVPADPLGRATALNNLGESLHHRHGHTGDPADLDEAVTTLRTAVAAAPEDHPHHVLCLNSLGGVLLTRYVLLGDHGDVDEAIRVQRAALAAAPAGAWERTRSLIQLASAVHQRLLTPNAPPEDLPEAVSLARQALSAAPAGSVPEHHCRALLVNVLQLRFDLLGSPDDLAEAVALGQVLLRDGAGGTPQDLEEWRTAGAGALLLHHSYNASPADLDEAIEAQRAVLRALPPRSPRRPVALHNLALALIGRSVSAPSEGDVNAAIDAQRAAVAEAGPRHSGRFGLLAGLGTHLLSRYTLLGARADLDEAIDAIAEAAEAAGRGHPARHRILPSWCDALLLRAEASGAAADLDTAVALAREAAGLVPQGSPRRRWVLAQAGRALLLRHRHQGTPADLDAAIAVLRQADEVGGQGGADRFLVLSSLSQALRTRHARDGAAADLDAAADLAARIASAPTAPPWQRLDAALTAGQLVWHTDPAGAVRHFETAVTLLPMTAPRQLRRREQQRMLGQFAGLARNAAAAVLTGPTSPDQRAEKALKLLETGRGVLIGQALDVWSDLTALRARHPELADTFERTRNLLDLPDDGTDALLGGMALTGPDGTTVVADRHRLAGELTSVLAEIRNQDGFGSFGLPPSARELLAAARDGTVVVLNPTAERCDALLVTSAGVTSLPLPGLTLENGIRAAAVLQGCAHDATDPDASVRTKAQHELFDVLGWLWDTVAEPVLTALGHDRTPTDSAWPRLWWVPCGPLNELPFHAAGHHDGSGRAVLDRVVSSYSPTVRALHHARRPLPPEPATGLPLIVAMPDTPGHPPLDFAQDEAEVFEERMGDVTVLLAPERLPTRDDVLGLLPGCPVAHFACHGDSRDADPSRHHLLLHDHADTPLTVEALASVRLDHARLAYLSACHSAVSYDGVLADESIHLASAFQLSGFRHVIGTLWPVVDDTAIDFAEAFYDALRPGPGSAPDPDRAPLALHTAVHALRARLPGSPSLWASHIHTGA